MGICVDAVLKKAKIINFPRFQTYNDKANEGWRLLPVTDDFYEGLPNNSHHYTTEYHRKYVLPLLEEMFHFGYDENHFILSKNMICKNDMVFDLSYQAPKEDMKFHVTCFNNGIEYDCGHDGLLRNNQTKKSTWFTPYHALYCFPHMCSTVENLSNNNGRSLLILGDSQIIPSVATLCCYYRVLTYLDNRDKIPIIDKLSPEYDDVLIEINGNTGMSHYVGYFV